MQHLDFNDEFDYNANNTTPLVLENTMHCQRGYAMLIVKGEVNLLEAQR